VSFKNPPVFPHVILSKEDLPDLIKALRDGGLSRDAALIIATDVDQDHLTKKQKMRRLSEYVRIEKEPKQK
jgi:hypothetical protein